MAAARGKHAYVNDVVCELFSWWPISTLICVASSTCVSPTQRSLPPRISLTTILRRVLANWPRIVTLSKRHLRTRQLRGDRSDSNPFSIFFAFFLHRLLPLLWFFLYSSVFLSFFSSKQLLSFFFLSLTFNYFVSFLHRSTTYAFFPLFFDFPLPSFTISLFFFLPRFPWLSFLPILNFSVPFTFAFSFFTVRNCGLFFPYSRGTSAFHSFFSSYPSLLITFRLFVTFLFLVFVRAFQFDSSYYLSFFYYYFSTFFLRVLPFLCFFFLSQFLYLSSQLLSSLFLPLSPPPPFFVCVHPPPAAFWIPYLFPLTTRTVTFYRSKFRTLFAIHFNYFSCFLHLSLFQCFPFLRNRFSTSQFLLPTLFRYFSTFFPVFYHFSVFFTSSHHLPQIHCLSLLRSSFSVSSSFPSPFTNSSFLHLYVPLFFTSSHHLIQLPCFFLFFV